MGGVLSSRDQRDTFLYFLSEEYIHKCLPDSDDEEDIKLDVLESKDERQDSYLVPGVGDFTAVSLQHLSESNTEQVQMLKGSVPMTPREGHKRGKSYAGAGRRVRAHTLTKSLIGNTHRPSLPPM